MKAPTAECVKCSELTGAVGRGDLDTDLVRQLQADAQHVSVLRTLQVRKLWEEQV